MVHQRFGRFSNTFLRECGRKHPIWALDWYCSGIDRMHQWGYETGLEARRRKARQDFGKLLQKWQTDRTKATTEGLPHAEARPVEMPLEDLPGDKDGYKGRQHIRIVNEKFVFFDGDNSIELARFIGKREDFFLAKKSRKPIEHDASLLLNGDGFDSGTLQGIQALLRRNAHIVFSRESVMIVPYMALNAAGVKIDTMRRLQVTRDGEETVFTPISDPSTSPARNIYGTGHIATRVARQKNGVTFALGVAAHYPAFTEPGRRPDHRNVELTPLDKWFLCVRNTVPRGASTPDSSPTAAEAEAAVKQAVVAKARPKSTKEVKSVSSSSRAKAAV